MKRLPNTELKWYRHLTCTLEAINMDNHVLSVDEAACLLVDSLIKQGFEAFTTGRDYYYTLRVFTSWCQEREVSLISQL